MWQSSFVSWIAVELARVGAVGRCHCWQKTNTPTRINSGFIARGKLVSSRRIIVPGCTKTIYSIDCPPTEPDKLQNIVSKHFGTLDLFLESKPIARHTAEAFELLTKSLPSDCGDLILDSGCGTGRSSLLLGHEFPECTVIGVDRSLHRLSKKQHLLGTDIVENQKAFVHQVSSNVWLVRAELVEFWRLLLQEENKQKYKVTMHYLLYPNPYPKPKRVKSRWYAHPAFPLLMRLASERTIVRSNWDLYLQEFATAAKIIAEPQNEFLCVDPVHTIEPHATTALTNFERKYWSVGEPTFELVLRR
jgi:tRNA G46 methylase TrmB